jgi:hypothetical protein
MVDITEYEEPNIMFFQGVFPEKYDLDTMFTNRIMDSLRVSNPACENIDVENTVEKTFSKIPLKFTTIDEWPKSTNIKCWWCTQSFKTVPLFIPSYIATNGDMVPEGNICTFNCGAAYIDVFVDAKCRWERHEMLKILHHKITGISVKHIPPSPLPFTMVQYGGGNDSSDTYTKKIATLTLSMTKDVHTKK